MEFNCPKCGSANFRFMANVLVSTSAKNYGNLSKSIIKKKETEIWGVNWSTMAFICRDCHSTVDFYPPNPSVILYEALERIATGEGDLQERAKTALDFYKMQVKAEFEKMGVDI